MKGGQFYAWKDNWNDVMVKMSELPGSVPRAKINSVSPIGNKPITSH